MRTLSLLIFSIALSGSAAAQPYLPNLQESHIAANVPGEQDFARFLDRDLLAYFRSEVSPDIVAVTWTLLREEPTQSGVSYPKFYLWVRADSQTSAAVEGAVRVAAVNRESFHVTHYIPSADISSDPGLLSSIFPAALVPAIAARAEAR